MINPSAAGSQQRLPLPDCTSLQELTFPDRKENRLSLQTLLLDTRTPPEPPRAASGPTLPIAAPAPSLPGPSAGGDGSSRAQLEPLLSQAARRGFTHRATEEPSGAFPSPAHIHRPRPWHREHAPAGGSGIPTPQAGAICSRQVV